MAMHTSTAAGRNLLTGFARSLARVPEQDALLLGEQPFTYRQLGGLAAEVAGSLKTLCGAEPLVGLLAARSLSAFAGVLGILGAGKGFLPMRPDFPVALIRYMCALSGVRVLVADQRALPVLSAFLQQAPDGMVVLTPEVDDLGELARQHPRHRFISARQRVPGGALLDVPQPGDCAPACLLFTSGTTGLPKGVPISHGNITTYLDYSGSRLGIRGTDRIAHLNELDFDCGMHDLFLGWEHGACVCCPGVETMRMPASYLRDQQVTALLSVPSLILLLGRARRLWPGAFPHLRLALFAGEALTLSAVRAFRAAAPHAVLYNMYGPTEGTIGVTHYLWDDDRSPARCEDGGVPIGWMFPHLQSRIVGPDLVPVGPGEVGELCISGPQVAGRYHGDEAQTRAKYVRLEDDRDLLYYRTGDLIQKDAGRNMRDERNLLSGFARSLARFPDRTALLLDRQPYSYRQLAAHASDVSATLRALLPAGPLVGVLASRSLAAFAGVLGTLSAGKGYLPLRPDFPPALLRHLCEVGQVRTLIVDERAGPTLDSFLPLLPWPMTVIKPAQIAGEGGALPVPDFGGEALAALLFTSGTTGLPKGVPISHANIVSYIEQSKNWLDLRETDRVANLCELDFDGAMHDLFTCWEHGACLCCPMMEAVRMPASYLRDQQVSVMLAVPSTVINLSRSGRLGKGAFPALRLALLGGEALPLSIALAFREAAPAAVLFNEYGPTEATIGVSTYRWDDERSPGRCEDGLVPIGWLVPDHAALIVGPDLQPVPASQTGELCVAGPQVTGRYFRDRAQTRARFVHLDADDETPRRTFYRTGDLVRQDADGCLHYKGRIDQQVQVHGCRVELCGVENVLRQAAGTDLCAVVPWPIVDGAPQGLVGLVCAPADGPGDDFDEQKLLRACAEHLIKDSMPSRIYRIAEMPLNRNGKIDRGLLPVLVAELVGSRRRPSP